MPGRVTSMQSGTPDGPRGEPQRARSHRRGSSRIAAPPALAEGTSATLFVPIVLSSGGAGASFYTSELTLTNRGTTAATVELRYTAAFGGGEGTCSRRSSPASRRSFRTRSRTCAGAGVPLAEGAGPGRNTPARHSPASRLRTRPRPPSGRRPPLRHRNPSGRRGSSYPGIPPVDRHRRRSATLYGLRTTADDRSNVAVYNPTTEPVTVRVTALPGTARARRSSRPTVSRFPAWAGRS